MKTMKVAITILGSGSEGNSIVVHTKESAIMIDAGFSRTTLIERLNQANIDPSIIKALILSHEHTDHAIGARVFADHLNIPTYVTPVSRNILLSKKLVSQNSILFEPGAIFSIENFSIKSFSVPHDAHETVGFVISHNSMKIGIATDLGHLTALCEQRLKGCNTIILESNHDVTMQLNSNRSPNLKKRILGRNGHLSNDDAVNALERLITENTQQVFLVHLSKECNNPSLVEKIIREKLAQLNREDILLQIADQKLNKTIFLN